MPKSIVLGEQMISFLPRDTKTTLFSELDQRLNPGFEENSAIKLELANEDNTIQN